MTTTISGTSGITYPAGGTDNVAGSGVGTTDTQTLTNKTLSGATWTSPSSSTITSGTAQNSTSGTAILFTGIPSWAKRVTVMLSGISTNGTSIPQIQLGTSSGPTTTGYVGVVDGEVTAGGIAASLTTGLGLIRSGIAAATNIISGQAVFTNVSGNNWVGIFVGGATTGGPAILWAATQITLGATLDRVNITTVNGTDTFDAGSINILYE